MKKIRLADDLFLLQAFFNEMSEESFLRCLESFARGIGAGFNNVVCEFPTEIDPDDEIYCGVKFYLFNEELIVPYPTFYDHLALIADRFLEINTDKFNDVQIALRKIHEYLNTLP